MAFNFRTIFELKKNNFLKITYEDSLFFIGSCFSETIGSRFGDYYFESKQNPFGVSFNPISIGYQLERISEKKLFSEIDIFEREGIWNSFDLHGSFNSLTSHELLERVNNQIQASHDFLSNASHIFITLGTAWVYKLVDSNLLVNNCHKFPGSKFKKSILSVDEIYQSLLNTNALLRKMNKDIQVIYTISPVRHLKDGFEENSLSKATLRLAIQKVTEQTNSHYFPVYEILMDDLRDYRFYKEDLVHPNNIAIEYIWEFIEKAFLENETLDILDKVKSLKKSLSHKPFNPDSKAHLQFIETTRKLILDLKTRGIKLEKELKKLDY